MVGAIFEGVGVSAGSFIAGYLMTEIGGSATFALFGFAAMALSVVHFIVQYLMDKYSTEPGKEQAHTTITQEKYTFNGGDAMGLDKYMQSDSKLQTPFGSELIS